jgi:hypothetical protein
MSITHGLQTLVGEALAQVMKLAAQAGAARKSHGW